jgi:predicted transposase YbfD/YdcC
VHAFPIEPLEADFAHARALIVVRSRRTLKKTGLSSSESRYYLSSVVPQQYRPEQWLKLICGHWAGVEIRNHWRRDVIMGEDGSRSRNPNLLANLALIRSALLWALAEEFADRPQPEIHESLHSNPSRCLALVSNL